MIQRVVFEEHLPECTPLYDIPVRRGVKAALKAGDVSDFYQVLKVEDGKAICIKRGETEAIEFPVDDLVTIAEFGEPIYPYLKPIDTVCNAPDSDLCHTLIEADNYHALQLLEYLYAGKVDCIYIDPPYNTGARDWKYNNDYVDNSDAYKHSKWLSMMQKRLRIAKRLLNPSDSALIVAIDEKEYLHLLNQRTFKKNLNLLTADGKYNVMAQLLSDNSQIPIRFGLFTGKTKASTMYAVREFGNDCLLYSLDGILRYGEVLNVPQADERDRVVERKEVMLFNQNAYREAVINAFVHNHWLDGAPAFTVFEDRIEILSRGTLPPKQTMDGFFSGESVPVNEKLAKIILQLHISEQTGRGVPAIVEAYGKEAFHFAENNIKVTIPFERIGKGVDAPVEGENVPVDAPVKESNVPVGDLQSKTDEEKILEFCMTPRGIIEIAAFLGYKDKRSVRKRLNPLLEQGRLAMTVPEKPNSRLQKYITIK